MSTKLTLVHKINNKHLFQKIKSVDNEDDIYTIFGKCYGEFRIKCVYGEGEDGYIILLTDNKCLKWFKQNNYDYEILGKIDNNKSFPKLYVYKKEKFMVKEFIQGILLLNYKVNNLSWEHINVLRENLINVINQGILIRDLHMGNIVVDNNGLLRVFDVSRFSQNRCFKNDDAISYLEIDKIIYEIFKRKNKVSDLPFHPHIKGIGLTKLITRDIYEKFIIGFINSEYHNNFGNPSGQHFFDNYYFYNSSELKLLDFLIKKQVLMYQLHHDGTAFFIVSK